MNKVRDEYQATDQKVIETRVSTNQRLEVTLSADYTNDEYENSLQIKRAMLFCDSNNGFSQIRAFENSKRSSLDSCLIKMNVDLYEGISSQIQTEDLDEGKA